MNLLRADVAWLTIYPDDTVHDEAHSVDYQAAGLYEQLLYAGYPLWAEPGSRNGAFDLLTDGRTVVARTGVHHGQTVMPDPTAALLLDWWRTAQPDHEEP